MNTNKLLIMNLDSSTSANEIEHLFSIYGDVEKVRIRRAKGIGYVEMTSAPEAKRACKNLDGSILWGRSLKIRTMDDSLRHRFMYAFGKYLF
jgi:RNA recognition motif-containing protein